jgi:hypothetical protein
VEIYQPGFGWQPVEATPGFSADEKTITDKNAQDYQFKNHLGEISSTSSAVSSAVSSQTASSRVPSALPSTAQSGVSSGKAAEPVPEKGSNAVVVTLLSVLALLAVLAGSAVLKRRIQLARRAELFGLEDTNRAVIGIYEYLQKLNRFGGEISEEITDIALKARFSRHRISEEERQKMVSYAETSASEIYTKLPKVEQFIFRYFYNLI